MPMQVYLDFMDLNLFRALAFQVAEYTFYFTLICSIKQVGTTASNTS